MNETWKKRARMALRGFEILLAVMLLAVLIELVLVMVTAPGPVPEIRFIRVSPPPAEAVDTVALVPAKFPPAPEPAAPVKPAVPAAVPPAPRRPAPPALLDFENLRRILGVAKAPVVNNPGSGGGSDGGTPGAGAGGQVVALQPLMVPQTNGVPASPTPPGTNGAPERARPPETNRTDAAAANAGMSTNNVNTNLDSPVFRISVP